MISMSCAGDNLCLMIHIKVQKQKKENTAFSSISFFVLLSSDSV